MVFAIMTYVLASYTSIVKTSQPITSSISKNPKVSLVESRTKKIDDLLNIFVHY
jgi:hypothetical protein